MRDIPYEVFYPTNWRKVLGFKQGSGTKRSELKQQAIDMIYDRYGITATNDEADAICIGMAYIKKIYGGKSMTKIKKSEVSKMASALESTANVEISFGAESKQL